MGIKNFIKKEARSGFNVKRWIAYDEVADSSKVVGGMFKSLYGKKKAKPRKETFEQAVQRLGLNDEDIEKRMKTARTTSFAFLAGSLLLFLYTIILVVKGYHLISFIAFMLTFMLLAYSFRENFNYFQMKQRRLGCTFKEWFAATFKGSK